MKNAVKYLVDVIEKEINIILDNSDKSEHNFEKEFEYGKYTFDLMLNDDWDKWEEKRKHELTLEVKSVEITNENGKALTNLSKEVFNQLEENYTDIDVKKYKQVIGVWKIKKN